jgi:hypothetical protein
MSTLTASRKFVHAGVLNMLQVSAPAPAPAPAPASASTRAQRSDEPAQSARCIRPPTAQPLPDAAFRSDAATQKGAAGRGYRRLEGRPRHASLRIGPISRERYLYRVTHLAACIGAFNKVLGLLFFCGPCRQAKNPAERLGPVATQSAALTKHHVFARRWHLLEQAMTVMGLVTACVGLMSLLAFGLGWTPASGFLKAWLVLAVCASPSSIWIYRFIKPLFWR